MATLVEIIIEHQLHEGSKVLTGWRVTELPKTPFHLAAALYFVQSLDGRRRQYPFSNKGCVEQVCTVHENKYEHVHLNTGKEYILFVS